MSGSVSGAVAAFEEQSAIMEELSSMADSFSVLAGQLAQMSGTFRLTDSGENLHQQLEAGLEQTKNIT
ncbi:hypothetical protein [Desulforamulus hydrothermalis]|uniref:Methyl-accepting chemotaxis protein n=1 Tax=Desulforamulus hydrothermalis Lam5 = DSM 18033 TaxID=1121428 RepID=K8EBK7_9FIRM|nr:hypothetical protein [Desulforamulus hydrothermalis]CCO09048.1 hypothetical protein DESHY_60220 [Desulforamulus hydrothermalis Lam5 = DSM 18033]